MTIEDRPCLNCGKLEAEHGARFSNGAASCNLTALHEHNGPDFEIGGTWPHFEPGEKCSYRFDHDPVTLAPRGRACESIAIEEIHWKDGRFSVACSEHGMDSLTDDARALVVHVKPLNQKRGPMPIENLKVGDEVKTMITGFVRARRAKVVEFSEHRGNTPILQVLDDETGEPDLTWPMKLKDGDYIIMSKWGE